MSAGRGVSPARAISWGVPPNLYLTWQTDPVLIGGLVTFATLFALAAGPLRSRLAPGRPFPVASAVGYYGALALMYLLEGSPLHDLAERYSLTAHMVQHLGISYAAAPLLLWSVPDWMLRPLLLNRIAAPASRLLTRPLVAFGVFTIGFGLWHVPSIYDGALRNSTLHHAEHLLFLFASLLMWWPLMSRLSELPGLAPPVRVIYLFLLPVAQTPVFGAITFAGVPIYDTYAQAPWTLGMDVVAEQALAGAVMKIAGLVAFGIPIAWNFARWYRDDMKPKGGPLRARLADATPVAATNAAPPAPGTTGEA